MTKTNQNLSIDKNLTNPKLKICPMIGYRIKYGSYLDVGKSKKMKKTKIGSMRVNCASCMWDPVKVNWVGLEGMSGNY